MLLLSIWAREIFLARVSLILIALLAIAGGLVYYSGLRAELFAHHMSWDAEEGLIHAHKTLALRALVCLEFTGATAAWALFRLQNPDGSLNRKPLFITFILGLVAATFLSLAANVGGQINHPEIREPDWEQQFPRSPHHD